MNDMGLIIFQSTETLSQFFTVVVGALVLVFFYYWATNPRRKLEALFPTLPGPKPLPFLGGLLDSIKVKGQLHLLFDMYCRKYGKVFAMVSFTGEPGLVVTDPEIIKHIMVKDFTSFHDRPRFVRMPEPLDKMLQVVEGDTWSRIRRILSPTFSSLKLKMMIPLMNECIEKMLNKLTQVADADESFDIFAYHQRLTLDVIMSSAFGIKSDCQTNPNDDVAAKVTRAMTPGALQKIVFALVFVLPFKKLLFNSKWVSQTIFKNWSIVNSLAQQMIEMKRKGDSSGRKDMLDLMLAAESPDKEDKKLSDGEIVANCTIFLLAGYETSATTLAVVCHYLATNKDVQKKLQEEIDSVWENENALPNYECIRELPYLDMVICEALRLCPPGALITRVATVDAVVKGISIPKGTPIIVPVYSLHRDPSFWPNPDTFDPMRFSSEAKQSRDPYCYSPFGHGPHSCIGLKFAQMELKLTIARILRKFSFVVARETQIPIRIAMETNLTTPDGVKLKVSYRE